MKVECPSCSASFLAPDDKIRGRVVKYRCRKCAGTIVADGTKLGESLVDDTQVMGKDEVLSGWDTASTRPRAPSAPPPRRSMPTPPPLPEHQIPSTAPRKPQPSVASPAALRAPKVPSIEEPKETPAPAANKKSEAPQLGSLATDAAAPAAALEREEKSGLHDLRALAKLAGYEEPKKDVAPPSGRHVDLEALLGGPSSAAQKLAAPTFDWGSSETAGAPLWQAPQGEEAKPAPVVEEALAAKPAAKPKPARPAPERPKVVAEVAPEPSPRPAAVERKSTTATVPPVSGRASTTLAPSSKRLPTWVYPAAIAGVAAVALLAVRGRSSPTSHEPPVAHETPAATANEPVARPAEAPAAETKQVEAENAPPSAVASAPAIASAEPAPKPENADAKEPVAKKDVVAASDETKRKDETKAAAPKDDPKQDGAKEVKAAEPKAAEPEKKDDAKKDEPKPQVEVAAAAFDKDAARSALAAAAAAAQSCKKEDSPSGVAHVSVTFAPSGRVTSAVINGPPFAGTSVGGCIASTMRSARVPAFGGDPVTVSKSISLN